MPALITDRTTAYNQLLAMVQPDSAPTLTHDGSSDPIKDEVGFLLDQFETVEVVRRNTAYGPNVRIVPDTLNGHVYRVGQNADGTSGGTTGATAPTYWPLNNPWPGEYLWWAGLGGGSRYVVDGTVTWYEDGPQPVSLWDLRAAAYEGWMRKAGKIAGTPDSITDGTTKIDYNGAAEGCRKQAMRYAPVDFG